VTKEEIGAILKELRLSCGMTQKEVALALGRKQQIVGHWETGYSQPDANTLFTLCNIYGTSVDIAFGFKKKDFDISKNDIELLKKYRTLDGHGKEIIDLILDKEYERTEACRKQPPRQETPNMTHLITYYQKNASAGRGELLFDDMYESKIPLLSTKEVEQADFAVGVNGSSMEPLYNDGDILLVKAQEVVEIGEIGIFIINNESFVKKAGEDRLISINPEYDDIIIHESDRLRCVGKVIGKVEAG